MEVAIEDIGPCRKRLKVSVPAERVRAHVDGAYLSAGRRVRMKGFRPGKIPRSVLEQRLGGAILADAKESLINETFREALQSNSLAPIGEPKLEVGEGPLTGETCLDYEVEVDLKPRITVGDISEVEVRRRPSIATDEDVQRALDDLARSKRKLETVEEAIAEGDFAKVNLSYLLEGAEIVRREGLQINTRIPVVGTDAEEFGAKLVGVEKGGTAVVPMKFPENFEKEEARGKDGELRIEVLHVLRFVAPEIDDGFAKAFDFDSVAAMRSRLAERITDEKTRSEDQRVEDEILEVLYAQAPFDLPAAIVDDEVRHRAKSLAADLEQQGMPKEDAERRVSEAKSEIEDQARIGIRNLFLVEAIGKKAKLFVTETDVANKIRQIAAENGVSSDEVREHYEKNELLADLRLQILNRKVRDSLKASAKVSDTEEPEAG